MSGGLSSWCNIASRVITHPCFLRFCVLSLASIASLNIIIESERFVCCPKLECSEYNKWSVLPNWTLNFPKNELS